MRTLLSHRFHAVNSPVVANEQRPRLHPAQAAAFRQLRGKRRAILNAPTGWGKSIVMACLIRFALLRNKKLRAIIAVPQTVIAPGFSRRGRCDWLLKLPGVRPLVAWLVGWDLCDPQVNNTVARLIDFLKGPHPTEGDRVLLCTHATLCKTYKKLRKQRRLALLQNLVLWIDEAHHIKNAQVKGREQAISNQMGMLLLHCLNTGNHVGLATATFMRGDLRHILPDATLNTFMRHSVPYDEYFADKHTCPVRGFKFHILCGPVTDSIASILRKPAKTILYLAKRNSRFATACKYKEVREIIRTLEHQRRSKAITDGPVIRIGSLRVLDLVTEKGREQRQEYLNSGGPLDLIIALDTCKEGFDWTEAERSIIVGERHSVPEMIQMIGRLFRRHGGKPKQHVDVYQLLPIPQAARNAERIKDDRNAVMTVIFSAMLLEDVFVPISGTKRGGKQAVRLAERFADTEAWQQFIRDFLALASECESKQEFFKLAGPLCKRHNLEPSILETVWARLTRLTSKRRRKVNSVEVYKHIDVINGLLTLCSDLCGAVTLQEFRALIGRETRTAEEWVPIAEKLAKENGGLLPKQRWLQLNGYSGLARLTRLQPELFEHIKQERPRLYDPKEWVTRAEKLASRHGGTLPGQKWLCDNGYSGLARLLSTHPELFKHIPQERIRKTPEEWVLVAEKLAKKNRGILPTAAWIQRNGYYGLAIALRKHPKLFAHLSQEFKGGKKADEWLPIAKQLARENGGKLPCRQWLVDNGYHGLYQMLAKFPKLFKHLEIERKTRPAKDWVPVAEKLAKENGDTLPHYKWLTKNGYYGLAIALNHYPELFAHLSQEHKLRTPAEWVPVVEELAKKNGGKLQSRSWLERNGYNGLAQAVRKHSDLFDHIPQEYKGGKLPSEWVPVAEKLAEENGGTLPLLSWLTKNGYSGMALVVKNNPKLFKHIPMKQSSNKSPGEWLPIAEKLAANNGGALPNPHWLAMNGYGAMYTSILNHREIFSHIYQPKFLSRQPIEHWIKLAKELVSKNGGKLPAYSWLIANGHRGLYKAMRKCPDKFAAIKRESKPLRMIDEWIQIANKLATQNGGLLPNYVWLKRNGCGGLPQMLRKYPQRFGHIKRLRLKTNGEVA